jgi:hypothetical protein
MKNLWLVLRKGDTATARLWFAFISFFWAAYTFSQPDDDAFRIIFTHLDYRFWGVLFAVHGVAMLSGIAMAKTDGPHLLAEGVLGCFLWLVMGLLYTWIQRVPGPTLAGAFIAVWLLLRYPYEWSFKK